MGQSFFPPLCLFLVSYQLNQLKKRGKVEQQKVDFFDILFYCYN